MTVTVKAMLPVMTWMVVSCALAEMASVEMELHVMVSMLFWEYGHIPSVKNIMYQTLLL